MEQKTGAHGWPLVPSTRFEGETMLACPDCGKSDIIMSSIGAGVGSGHRGAYRFGDNYCPTIECKACGRRDIGAVRMHTVNGGTREI